ncbi:dihydrofolate reductase [Rhizobium sp. SG_E_25_P2]|uniref:dihydrofolate reductase n=1 Tax=Rhizobium sp. SG_E_25_P2 TaxID=2879942 RepID=UPI002474EE72|nr:dihydrofolate reductase [Rhizobium sp. SG_E_25_P2]MDH6267853.1 dihydrofolate reductase [Rhizobium sp. SG_E_25_P2]
MKISIVVAMADKGVIGRDNGLPWRQSSDLKRFKAMTLGKPVVMGRKCYASIGKPLPGRTNIVVTRNRDFAADGVAVVHDYDAGVALATQEAGRLGADEICVIGGGEIYRLAFETADLLHVTHILGKIDGDTFFPAIDPDLWEAIDGEELPASEKDDYPTRFVTYRRRSVSGT